MGFLNPFLYQNEDAFFDVTVGNGTLHLSKMPYINDFDLGSDKIGRSGQAVPYGFECATGWDPVTGMHVQLL